MDPLDLLLQNLTDDQVYHTFMGAKKLPKILYQQY